jgi:hypothetical protein
MWTSVTGDSRWDPSPRGPAEAHVCPAPVLEGPKDPTALLTCVVIWLASGQHCAPGICVLRGVALSPATP